jgi:hypothetical protein
MSQQSIVIERHFAGRIRVSFEYKESEVKSAKYSDQKKLFCVLYICSLFNANQS